MPRPVRRPVHVDLRAALAAEFRRRGADYAARIGLPIEQSAGDDLELADQLEAGGPVEVPTSYLPRGVLPAGASSDVALWTVHPDGTLQPSLDPGRMTRDPRPLHPRSEF